MVSRNRVSGRGNSLTIQTLPEQIEIRKKIHKAELANSTLEGVGYNAQAAERSWAAMLELFRERLNQSK